MNPEDPVSAADSGETRLRCLILPPFIGCHVIRFKAHGREVESHSAEIGTTLLPTLPTLQTSRGQKRTSMDDRSKQSLNANLTPSLVYILTKKRFKLKHSKDSTLASFVLCYEEESLAFLSS